METLNIINDWIIINEEMAIYIFFLIVLLIIFLMWYAFLKPEVTIMSKKKQICGFFLLHMIAVFFFLAFYIDGLIYIYLVPPVGVTTILLYMSKSPEEICVQTKVLYAYKYTFVYLFFLLLANNKLSSLPLADNVLYTIVFVFILALTLDEITNINERYLMHMVFLLTVTSGIATTINYKLISFVILLMFWLLPQVKVKTKMNLKEKEMIEEVDIGQVNFFNRYMSQLFFVQLLFREKINSLQKDAIGGIVYTLILINFFFLVKIVFGVQTAIFISFFWTSFDFNSRITARRFAINPNLVKKTLNNLPELQKRHMQRVANAVVEYATTHPAQTVMGVGSLIGYSTYSYFHAENMALQSDVLEVQKQEIEATNKATEATEKYTQEMDKSRKDANTAKAEEQMKEAVTDDYYNLQKEQYKTGEIKRDDESLKIIDEEIQARKEKEVKKGK